MDLGEFGTGNAAILAAIIAGVFTAVKEVLTFLLGQVRACQQLRRKHYLLKIRLAQHHYQRYLVIRLVKASELSLHTSNTPLPTSKIWDNLNPPSRWRSIAVQRRNAVGSAELQQARNLARDVFGALPPEDEDRLHAELQKQLTVWQQDFRHWRSLAASAGYPGKALAEEGEALCDKLLAAPDS